MKKKLKQNRKKKQIEIEKKKIGRLLVNKIKFIIKQHEIILINWLTIKTDKFQWKLAPIYLSLFCPTGAGSRAHFIFILDPATSQ